MNLLDQQLKNVLTFTDKTTCFILRQSMKNWWTIGKGNSGECLDSGASWSVLQFWFTVFLVLPSFVLSAVGSDIFEEIGDTFAATSKIMLSCTEFSTESKVSKVHAHDW